MDKMGEQQLTLRISSLGTNLPNSMNSRILNMERTLLPPEGGTMMMSSVFSGETTVAVSVVCVRKPSSGLMEMEPTPICNSKMEEHPTHAVTPLLSLAVVGRSGRFHHFNLRVNHSLYHCSLTYNLIERHFSVMCDDLSTRLVHLLVSQGCSQTLVSLDSRTTHCRHVSRRSLRGS